jgi:glutaredoxin 3
MVVAAAVFLSKRGIVDDAASRLTRQMAAAYVESVAMELTLYSREWCSWCIDAKDYLTERGYKFTEIDVGRDRDAYQEMVELSDQTYVPTLAAGDEVLANFDTDQLEAFLNKHGIVP